MQTHRRCVPIFAAFALGLAACGGAEAPETLARADTSSPTTAPTTLAAPTTVPTTAAVELTIPEDPASIEFSDEELASLKVLLDTPQGRQLVADGLVAETDMTADQANCFVESVDITSILSLAGDAPLVGDSNTDVILAFASCEIDIAILQDL